MRIPTFIPALIIGATVAVAPMSARGAGRAAIVPQPAQYTTGTADVSVPATLTVCGPLADDAVGYLRMRGLDAVKGGKKAFVNVVRDESMPAESYRLEVSPGGASITAADRAALMYAVETLSQIIAQAEDGMIASCTVNDSPRMAYRGMMIDVVRCYLPAAELEKLVDVAARLKLNKLHLHLTDDNGWRMEIRKYPKLTEVGAWRVDRKELFGARPNPQPGEEATYGGFYSQDELRELVRYAADRNIEVIPEIEMPAHAIGAIASYPDLTCPVNDDFIGVLTGIGGNRASVIMCAGNDNTLAFVKDVLDEVMDVFPSSHIHLGGDEANKSRWEKCPLCTKRVEDLGLGGYEELQAWFMDSVNSYVRSKGRTAIGWDEVTYGKPKEDMVIMGWQGTGAVAERYARETGRRFIMTPARYTYLIRYQGPQWFEPFTYFGNITLRDIYEWEPVKADWTDDMRYQLWGVQASMWTEFCRTPADVQYMMFPRLLALADVAWRAEGARDWQDFLDAVDCFLPYLDSKGMNHAASMYNIQHTARPAGDGTVTITAECIRPDVAIATAFDTNFTCPCDYSGPLTVGSDESVSFQATARDGRKGQPLCLDLRFSKATGRKVACDSCSNGLGPVLLNGIRGSHKSSDFEWAGWYDRRARFTVDLGEESPVSVIKLGVLANANMNVALPATVRVFTAGDDGVFSLLREVETDPACRYPLAAKVTDIDFGPADVNARYIRFEAENPGRVPAGFPRENNATWLYFDEITVN